MSLFNALHESLLKWVGACLCRHRADSCKCSALAGPQGDDEEEDDEAGGAGATARISIGFGEALEDEEGVLDLQNWSECVLCGEPVDNSWERCPTCGKKNPAGKKT